MQSKIFILGPPPEGSVYRLEGEQDDIQDKCFPNKKPLLTSFRYGKIYDVRDNLLKEFNPETDCIVLVIDDTTIRIIRGRESVRQLADKTNTPLESPIVKKWLQFPEDVRNALLYDNTERIPWEVIHNLI